MGDHPDYPPPWMWTGTEARTGEALPPTGFEIVLQSSLCDRKFAAEGCRQPGEPSVLGSSMPSRTSLVYGGDHHDYHRSAWSCRSAWSGSPPAASITDSGTSPVLNHRGHPDHHPVSPVRVEAIMEASGDLFHFAPANILVCATTEVI